jgi:hypothetical protein
MQCRVNSDPANVDVVMGELLRKQPEYNFRMPFRHMLATVGREQLAGPTDLD